MPKKPWQKRKLRLAINAINEADGDELLEIILAVCAASDRKHPAEEAVFLLLPRNDQKDRTETLDLFCAFMEKHSPPVNKLPTKKDSLW